MKALIVAVMFLALVPSSVFAAFADGCPSIELEVTTQGDNPGDFVASARFLDSDKAILGEGLVIGTLAEPGQLVFTDAGSDVHLNVLVELVALSEGFMATYTSSCRAGGRDYARASVSFRIES